MATRYTLNLPYAIHGLVQIIVRRKLFDKNTTIQQNRTTVVYKFSTTTIIMTLTTARMRNNLFNFLQWKEMKRKLSEQNNVISLNHFRWIRVHIDCKFSLFLWVRLRVLGVLVCCYHYLQIIATLATYSRKYCNAQLSAWNRFENDVHHSKYRFARQIHLLRWLN